MAKLVDLVKISCASTGPGAITLGIAVPGYRGSSVLTNGVVYSYAIQQGSNWEYGRATYLASGQQLVRSPISSSAGGAALDLQPNAAVAIVALVEDFADMLGETALVQSVKDAGAAAVGTVNVAGTGQIAIVNAAAAVYAAFPGAAAQVAADRADVTAKAADVAVKAADVTTKAAQVALNKTATNTARDQAVAAAAAVDTTQIANAVALTSADRAIVRADKIATDTNLASTQAAATAAQNAANASSNRKFFLTKALATAELAALAVGTAVEVNADESRFGQPSLYYKDGAGALAFARSLAEQVVIFYADNVYGSDTNDGLTPRTPVKSLARLSALTGNEAYNGSGKFGVVVRLNRNSRWNGEVLGGLPPFVRIEAYGQGEGPFIDASVPLLGAWVAVAGRTNVWYQDITFTTPVVGSVGSANSWHLMAFDEAPGADIGADGLPRILNGDPLPDAQYDPWQPQKTTIAVTSQSALLDILEASPIGGITAFKQGSTSYEPRTVSGGGDYAFRIYLKTADGTNPNTNGRTVYVSQMAGCAIMPTGVIVDGITFARAGNKDGFSAPAEVNPDNVISSLLGGYTVNCKFLQHGGHAAVDGGMSHYAFLTRGTYTRDNVKFACGSLHGFRRQNLAGITPGRTIANGRFERAGIAVYTHGDDGPPYAQHTGTDIIDCTGRDVNQFAQPGQILRALKIVRCTVVDCDQIVVADSVDGLTYIEDSTFTGRAGSLVSVGVTLPGTRIIMTRSTMRAGVGGTVRPMVPSFGNAIRELTPSTWPVLELRASKIIGRIPDPGNNQFCQIGVVLDTTSYLGVFDDQSANADMWIRNDAGSPGIVAAAGARIECRSFSIDALRSRFPGVAAGVETGVRQQVATKTLTLDDFAFAPIGPGVNASWGGTVNGDGTATLTTGYNYSAGTVGRYVRIIGAGAGGADYFGRVAAYIDLATIKVTPAPPASFTDKAMLLATLGPTLRDPVTGYISADGTQINVPATSPISAGQTVRVGKIQASGSAIGIRKVTARSGQVATLDTPCAWKATHEVRIHNSVATPFGDSSARLPAVQLSFGMSFITPHIGQPSATYSAAKVEGGTISGNADYFNIDYENGWWGGIIGLAVGDVLTLTSLIDIPEFRGPQGAFA